MDAGYNFSSMPLTSTSSLSTSTEQLMSPKSPPPGLMDFYGKRKQMVKIQVLEREVGLLQEELKSLEGLDPASRCCKELDAFVSSISDPFTPTKQTISESYRFSKQISLLPWACCCCSSTCLLHKKMVKGCACCSSSSSNSKSYLKVTSVQNCCGKLSATSCARSLMCFSCKCGVDPCSNCGENCYQRQGPAQLAFN